MRSQNSLCWMQETLMLVCPSDACVCAMHEHHEDARAALMRVASEVRLDQATWSSNARTLRVVMKETSLHVHGVESAVHTWT